MPVGQRIGNAVIRAILATPGLATLAGKRLVTLYVVGISSGKRYSIPVAYLPDGDALLIGTPFKWGRNLRTGHSVDLRLKGRLRTADVQVFSREADVVRHLDAICRANAMYAKSNGIRRGSDGTPDPGDLRDSWARGTRVFRLSPR